jgi:hypothetical protein
MTLTILIVFGALAVAAAISALLAPPGAPAERPFLPSQCVSRLTPTSRAFGRPRPF